VRVIRVWAWCGFLGLGGLGCALAAEPEAGSGLHQENGVLLRDGKPFRGIGVNYVAAFMRLLEDPADPSCEQAFKILGERGIPLKRKCPSRRSGSSMCGPSRGRSGWSHPATTGSTCSRPSRP